MSEKLKPCPFCGYAGEYLMMVDKIIHVEMAGEQIYYAYCGNQRESCEAHGPIRTSAKEAATAWNRRAK